MSIGQVIGPHGVPTGSSVTTVGIGVSLITGSYVGMRVGSCVGSRGDLASGVLGLVGDNGMVPGRHYTLR